MEGEILIILIPALIFLITSAVGAYVFNYFRHRKREITSNTKDLDKIKRILVMQAKRLDRGNKYAHPEMNSNFEELVKDLLTDDITDNE